MSTSVQWWCLTTSSEPCYSVKGSCFSLLYFDIKILQKSSGKNRAPLATWNIIVALMVIETTILVSCYICVTPQCLRGHPRPCFCTQGSRRILRALQSQSLPNSSVACSLGLWPTGFSLCHSNSFSSKPLASHSGSNKLLLLRWAELIWGR